MTALPTFATEANALQVDVNNNQVLATTAASTATTQANSAANSANQAAASAGAVLWVSGTTYVLGATVISPANVQTYRRKVAGAGTTDPSIDTANWTPSVVRPGDGGTTLTGSVTLVSTSPAAMVVTPSTYGLYATLPDATTMNKTTAPFSIYNAGDYDYGIKDNSGKQLGWVRARQGAVIGLSDNSSAAGIWSTYGLEKVGTTALYVNPTITSSGGQNITRITIDSNRTFILLNGGTGDLYAIIYDSSTQTWGTATLVRASVGGALGILSATNQVLVVSCSTTTAIQAVTLTISGTSITVNTAANATAGANWITSGQIVAVGTSWVFSFADATPAGKIRAITVSGTVPTIGAESNVGTTGSVAPILFASGSIVRTVVEHSGGSVVRFLPYTVSGSTLTVGTGGTTAISAAGVRAFINGNGNIVLQYINSTHFAGILKLTGTTDAISTISMGTAPGSIATLSDYVLVSSSKILFISSPSSNVLWHANILTDTSGTASAGTDLSLGDYANITQISAIGASGNIARFVTSQSSFISQWSIDCSGVSPTVVSTNRISISSNTPLPLASNLQGIRSGYNLVNGTTEYVINGDSGTTIDLQITPSSINRRVALNLSTPLITAGGNSNESWGTGVINSNSSIGLILQRIEVAA